MLAELFIFFGTADAGAQRNIAAYERITAVANDTALLYVPRPYHLQLEVTLPGSKDIPEQAGAIERWQSGEDSKTISTFGTASETQLQHNGKFYVLHEGGLVPDLAGSALDAVLHPGPYPADLAGTTPDQRRQAFGKVSLDCVMLDIPMNRLVYAPLGLFPTYCLTDTNDLAVTYNFGSQTMVQETRGKFQDHKINVGFSLLEGTVVVAHGKVSKLETVTPKPDQFEPTPELAASAEAVKVSGDVLAGSKIKGETPHYPLSARQNRISGAVVLKARIGVDGHIHYLVPASAPDPDLALAAIQAVRQWTYSPTCSMEFLWTLTPL